MPIVFVHLGRARAPWLLWNLRSAAGTYRRPLALVSDQLELLRAAERLGAEGFLWKPDNRDLAFTAIMDQRTRSFRQGFWAMTALRFQALAAFHWTIKGPLLHLESDVVLHPERAPTLDLSQLNGVALLRLGPGKAAAAVMHSAQPAFTRVLADRVITAMTDGSANEMAALDLARRSPEMRWLTLPTAPQPNPVYFTNQTHADVREDVAALAAQCQGVYDVAGIGQFLLGSDGRNSRGWVSLYRSYPDQYLDICQWELVTDGWGWPVVRTNVADVPILNLHVHSKDRRAFDPDSLATLLRRRVARLPARPARVFDARAGARLVKSKFATLRLGKK